MKTIGKIAVLAMTMALAFALTACGGGASSSASASASASSESASASAESAAASAESAASEAASSAAAAESSASAVEGADLYTNEAFGIVFHLPEGWAFKDLSAIQGVNELIPTAATNASIDMAATNAESNEMVLVSVETSNDENKGMSAEDYLEAQEKQMTDSLGQNDNYSYNTSSATVTFNGIDRELPACILDITVGGAQFFIGQAVAESEGNFFNVVCMAQTQDELLDLFKNFSAIQ